MQKRGRKVILKKKSRLSRYSHFPFLVLGKSRLNTVQSVLREQKKKNYLTGPNV